MHMRTFASFLAAVLACTAVPLGAQDGFARTLLPVASTPDELTQQLLTFAKGGAPVRKSAAVQDIIHESTAFASRGSNVICKHHAEPDLWAAEVDAGQMKINAVRLATGAALTYRYDDGEHLFVTLDGAYPVNAEVSIAISYTATPRSCRGMHRT